jgi:hypothetical protein
MKIHCWIIPSLLCLLPSLSLNSLFSWLCDLHLGIACLKRRLLTVGKRDRHIINTRSTRRHHKEVVCVLCLAYVSFLFLIQQSLLCYALQGVWLREISYGIKNGTLKTKLWKRKVKGIIETGPCHFLVAPVSSLALIFPLFLINYQGTRRHLVV